MEDAQAEESVNATDEVDYKAENERLRAELELKQAEVISLNEKLVAMAAGQPSVPSDDIASLSEKLNRLKEEAAKADAERDASWGDLKRCVQEVAKLANPAFEEEALKKS